MYSSFFKSYFIGSLILIFISACTIKYFQTDLDSEIQIDDGYFYWPLPNNHVITSNFGKRSSPTLGASIYHSGIDIAANEGTPIYSCFAGKVTLASFKGAGGFTLTITNGSFSASYCHISPKYLYKVGDYVQGGRIIAYVGPKNVYGVNRKPI